MNRGILLFALPRVVEGGPCTGLGQLCVYVHIGSDVQNVGILRLYVINRRARGKNSGTEMSR